MERRQGMINLGVLPGHAYSRAFSISGDGSVVGGSSGGYGIIWTAASGMTDLNAFLPSVGISLTGWILWDVTGVSADGLKIAGLGLHNGVSEAWIAVLPSLPMLCQL
jgi:uncharacterized membrane protein